MSGQKPGKKSKNFLNPINAKRPQFFNACFTNCMDPTLLQGKLISLRPAWKEDRTLIYEWLTQSDLTSQIIGPPIYPEIPIPSWEDFKNDYVDHYFNDSEPLKGRSFVTMYQDKPVGQINYNAIDLASRSTELDIWMKAAVYTGRGFGTDALNTLCDFLFLNFPCEVFYIAPSARNVVAIKSYVKAGFEKTSEIPANFQPDYHDTILFKKSMRNI